MDRTAVLEFWAARFGVPGEAFDGFRFFVMGKNVWVASDCDIPRLRYETLGLRMISLKERTWKPSTSALQVFGGHATKNAIDLDDDSAKIFMAGESIDIEADVEPGYVIVTRGDDILGCGLYSRGHLASQIPKERRMKIEENGM